MAEPWTCECGTGNGSRLKLCRDCGKGRPKRSAVSATGAPSDVRCPYDGELLREDDTGFFCERGAGYPYALPNPRYDPRGREPETLARHFTQQRKTVCPHCRERLDWNGGCGYCRGVGMGGGRKDWNFPGSRFDRYDDDAAPLGDGHHWRLTDPAVGRPAVSAEEGKTVLHAMVRALVGKMAAQGAHS